VLDYLFDGAEGPVLPPIAFLSIDKLPLQTLRHYISFLHEHKTHQVSNMLLTMLLDVVSSIKVFHQPLVDGVLFVPSAPRHAIT
jgi:hypothetical protein